MGAASSSAASDTARCIVRNQTSALLHVRTFEDFRPLAEASALSSGGVEVQPPCCAEYEIGRHALLEVEGIIGDGGKLRLAVRVGRGSSAPSAPQERRGGSARTARAVAPCAAPLALRARLVEVEPCAEIYANVDKAGALALRVFRKEPAGGGSWEALSSSDASSLFDAEAPDEAEAPPTTVAVVSGGPPKESATRSEMSEDEEEAGLYLTEGQWMSGLGSAAGPGEEDWGDAMLVDGEEVAHDDEDSAPPLPQECVCPISHELFSDPVLAADGFTYERRCIEVWLHRHGGQPSAPPKSPMTGRPLENVRMIPNLAIRSLCQEFRARWGNCSGERASRSDGDAACSSSACVAEPAGTSGFTGAQSSADLASSSFGSRDPGAPSVCTFEPILHALEEMFSHVPSTRLRQICAELSRDGVRDVDVVVRRVLQFAEANPVAGLPFTAVSIDTGPAVEAREGAAPHVDAPAFEFEEAPSGFEELFRELVQDAGIHPVSAKKAIVAGRSENIEEAIAWLEKHQEEKDLEVPEEELRERENYRVYLAVMRVSIIEKLEDRVECYILLHKVFGRIMADPENSRLRKIRSRNPLFRRRVGRFPPAMSLLRFAGFRLGDFWTSHQDREPCVEFSLPVDSDNSASVRFVSVFSVLDEIMSNPSAWIGLFFKAADSPKPPPPSLAARLGGHRARLAELHERRARDPHGFRKAMEAEGKRANTIIVNITQPVEPPAPTLAEGQARYRSLRERFGGKREFNLHDIEQMRTDEAIRGATLYGREYLQRSEADATAQGSDTYSALRSRHYDVQYLGRVCVDRTNAFRAQNRLPPVKWSQEMNRIAEVHAGQMARGEMPFSHLDFDKRVARYPFAHMGAGENLAYNGGQADVAAVAVDSWIKSPGHRKNLLGTWNLCGVGVAQSAGGMFYFTQLFARTPGPLS